MKIPTIEEKSRTKTSNIIMLDVDPDVNFTIKTALEENADYGTTKGRAERMHFSS